MADYYAHSGWDFTNRPAFQPLHAHLRGVADGAAKRASGVPLQDLVELARAAGWLHDLGKYRPEFQQLLHGGRVRGDPLTFHKQAGAALAASKNNAVLALVIHGHHGGLPNGSEVKNLLNRTTTPAGLPVADAIRSVAEPENDALQTDLPRVPDALRNPFFADLFPRVLFGCLVDADWADTGEHERSLKRLDADPEPPPLNPTERLEHVRAFIDEKAEKIAGTHIGQVRERILNACLAKATDSPGVFSLTVPTGGGKTLAGLAFALKHAAAHGLRRVIYVAPYLTILEQNATVIRQAVGVAENAPDVFAHYSLAEPVKGAGDEQTDPSAAARRAENWDAPIVVTTNVQFFESLFSNQPGRCRKLPNVARSVILLDECQSLPPGLVAPTCGMLRQLATDLGCTVVLCTATQPAFDHDKLAPDERLKAKEICEGMNLFAQLKRVTVTWPKPADAKWEWPEVAKRMTEGSAALCVVNTKKAARAVYEALKGTPGVFHLSTGMCPQHRREKLDGIKKRLKDEAPCYVVSTQLIEAGVDVDFPVVLREMAPLEGVIQAAGRCNREGNLPDAGGRVVVFRSAEGGMPLDDWYCAGRDKLEAIIRDRGDGPPIDDPAAITDYFHRLYYSGNLDGRGVQDMRKKLQFRTVGETYRLIDNAGQPVVVKWKPHLEKIEELLEKLSQSERPPRNLLRELAPYQVNLLPSKSLPADKVREGPAGVTVWDGGYDDEFGIVADEG